MPPLLSVPFFFFFFLVAWAALVVGRGFAQSAQVFEALASRAVSSGATRAAQRYDLKSFWRWVVCWVFVLVGGLSAVVAFTLARATWSWFFA